jgi:hypothetical protein
LEQDLPAITATADAKSMTVSRPKRLFTGIKTDRDFLAREESRNPCLLMNRVLHPQLAGRSLSIDRKCVNAAEGVQCTLKSAKNGETSSTDALLSLLET